MRIAFTTFGCKINQYDTDAMRGAVARDGNTIVPFDADADVYVINTCSVTGKSDYQCRQAIRAAARRGEGARVIVTGCYAETRPDEIRNIPGVTHVLGNSAKTEIARFCGPEQAVPEQVPGVADRHAESGRTRPVLKVQDGCDSRCSYCIVPRARGGSQSVAPAAVREMFERRVAAGAPEVVLSGIHIGRYGCDLEPRSSLGGLLRELTALRRNTRIRLSSIEPGELTPDIIALLGRGICRHVHIPLQSGDDHILRSMNRQYSAGEYGDLVRSLAENVPGIAIGADVMVGFPGEGEREFENTLRLIEGLPISYLHVFSYSPRPGTPAAAMDRQVPSSEKKKRNEALRTLGVKKNLEFRKGQRGSHSEVVVEEWSKDQGASGLTDNYISVAIPDASHELTGRTVTVVIADAAEDGTSARIQATG
jgi:threonylcarbamoyladenosine tRNA methylthiotransferase MtaB